MSQNGQDGFFGIIISTKILENKKLTVAEKFVYAYVSSYKNYCADSNARIGDRLGFSERTVTRCLKRLVDLGFLHIEFSKNNNSMRKIYDIYGKPNKKSNLSKNAQKISVITDVKPIVFHRFLHNLALAR